MPNTTAATGVSPAPKGLFARFIGIITEPTETFRSVAAHPKWLGMLVLTSLIVSVCAALPLTTEGGQQAAVDAQVRQLEGFGMQVSDEMYERLQSGKARMPYTAGGAALIVTPIITLVIAGIAFAIFNAAMGGSARFKQVFAVVVHASVISALAQLFTGPLNYYRGEAGSATNLGVLLPMLDGTLAGRLAGMIDLFAIWWVIVLAIGLGVLYRRRTQPIAYTFLAVYAVIAVCVAVVMSSFGGAN